jgi:hypothetical protein
MSLEKEIKVSGELLEISSEVWKEVNAFSSRLERLKRQVHGSFAVNLPQKGGKRFPTINYGSYSMVTKKEH